MSLSFLPDEIVQALLHLNYKFLSEIRLRKGQPAVVEYKGKYAYLSPLGATDKKSEALFFDDVGAVLNSATGGCVYNYTDQLKNGFITVERGVRIGVAGEYVTENGRVNAVKNITSLNIRIPHDIEDCAKSVCEKLFADGEKSTLVFSRPGMGKTTMLRDIARFFGKDISKNVLILDERGEISAIDGYGNGFMLGAGVDVVRCYSKLSALSSAVRAMKPDIIITDELYGREDMEAVSYAADCGICVIASSHVTAQSEHIKMPFEYYVKLLSIGGPVEIYDKNYNAVDVGRPDDVARNICFGK